MKSQRPFRAVTGSDDCTTILLNGVPFKFAGQQRKHSRFVQSVNYSPDGTAFLSAGSDGLVHLFNGLDGTELSSLIDPSLSPAAAHGGTIFSAQFFKDSKSIITSSGDKTTKLWSKDGKILRVWNFSEMQVGNSWIGEKILSLGISGERSILNPEKDGVEAVLHGRAFFPLSSVQRVDSSF